jgi:tRNA nucleotidyltransferase (CCA-adding enzyme)
MKIDLIKKFPRKISNIIKIIRDTCDMEDFRVYIVGGVVRDMLLNVPNYDLDFVVEGNGIEFAEILNRKFKGDLKIHRAFKTATIMFGNSRIDIATARNESYERPGSYPDVRPGTIKEDLFRRDFTINAMAVSVNKKDFGKLVDFYGGFRDLEKGLLRVMHERSFIDDPTRIFRAVRFSVRFNFKIEPHTRSLAKKAILSGLLGEVNRGRIEKEIELFLKEKNPLKCLRVFSALM